MASSNANSNNSRSVLPLRSNKALIDWCHVAVGVEEPIVIIVCHVPLLVI